jgi:hypothetical protein
MTSNNRIHIAIPNSIHMLCDPSLNLDSLRVGFIKGLYTATETSVNFEPTRFSNPIQTTHLSKFIKFGKQDPKHPIAYNDTVSLKEIYDSEGNFTITDLIIQFPYEEKIAVYGIPEVVQNIAYHHFRKWNFSPTFMATIFDRVPSHPLYEKLKIERRNFLNRTGDKESYKRFRSTWLVNKPVELLPYKIYELWYGKGALIIPEKQGDFKGRELGLGVKP